MSRVPGIFQTSPLLIKRLYSPTLILTNQMTSTLSGEVSTASIKNGKT